MKRCFFAGIFLMTGFLGAVGTQGDASDIVEIRLAGRYYIEPATVRVVVAIEPDERNRTLRIEADSDQMFRASDVTLNGADEKRFHTVELRHLPAGSYTLRAEVRSGETIRGTATQPLEVVGSSGQ